MSSSLDRYLGRILTIALAALVASLIAGCGKGSSSTSSSTSAQTSVASTRTTAGATGTDSSSTKTSGSSTSVSVAAGAAARAAEARKLAAKAQASGGGSLVVRGRVLRRFTGSENALLGTVVVGAGEVLVWRAQHPPLQIFTANRFILVSSHGSAGSVQLARGTYSGVRVASSGGWTIELRARS
jgi:hypothetical protein